MIFALFYFLLLGTTIHLGYKKGYPVLGIFAALFLPIFSPIIMLALPDKNSKESEFRLGQTYPYPGAGGGYLGYQGDGKASIQERLGLLEQLFAEGTLTIEEYDEYKRQILKDL